VLAAALAVTIAGIDQQAAERLVQVLMPSVRTRIDPWQCRCGQSPSRPVSPTDRFHPNPVLEHAARRSTVLQELGVKHDHIIKQFPLRA